MLSRVSRNRLRQHSNQPQVRSYSSTCAMMTNVGRGIQLAKMKKTKYVVWFCLLLFVVLDYVDAQDNGTAFITQKEEYVKQIAIVAGLIDGNCTLLANCQAECSRAVCYPRKEDLQANCVQVDENDLCLPTASKTSCDRFMKLNYERSYLTLPPPGDPEQLTPEVIRDICLQRALDETFKNISFQNDFSYVYFGSASGVFRAFPGRERMADRCSNYLLRRRPWYKNAISVQKQLKILVDTGNSMGSPLPSNYPPAAGSTFLEVASNIILQQLKTVSPEDFVDVATFNSSGVYQMQKIQVSSKFDESENSTELAPLETGVGALTNLPRSLPGQSNLTAAILNAVSNFTDAPTDTLKVIVIFTDGLFSPLDNETFPTARLLELRVKVILYKFPGRNDDLDPFLNTTTLRNILCGVNGTFELLDAVYSVKNPLYAIRSFYTFMARTQLAVANNNATWSDWYLSYSQPLNGTSVTYPAFGSDGQLIGVAGIDIYPENLPDTLKYLVYSALGNQTAMGNMPAPPDKINLVCNYQAAPRMEQQCSNGNPADNGVCEATDSTGLQQRVCCDGCLPDSNGNLVLKIALPVSLGLVAVFLICSCGFIWYQRQRELERKRNNVDIYGGPDMELPPSGQLERERNTNDVYGGPDVHY